MITEQKYKELTFMASDKIGAKHMFTTRFGGVSEGPFASLNLSSGRGDPDENVRENFRRVCDYFGVGLDDCAVTRQVHKNEVRIVTGSDRHVCLSPVPYEADGLVTAEKGLPIFCFTADCVPVLLHDPVAGVAGAIHCGWRSSVQDILAVALRQMASLGACSENIRAAIGPAIGRCCFETDDDVPQAIEAWLDGDTRGLFDPGPGSKTLVDLRLANARRLQQLGVRAENIDISGECTKCSHEKYWSHRYTKGLRGSQASAIML